MNHEILVDSVETLEAKIQSVRAAQEKFSAYTQEQVDRCKVYGEETITASDAVMVLQKALDEKVIFPVESK